MARVFISYSRSEREQIQALAEALKSMGHDVWWDTELLSGESFRTEIDKELNAADVAIVVWTPGSVTSNWVIAEADHAARLNKLLPLRMPSVEIWQIPKPYGTLHTDLIGDTARVAAAIEAHFVHAHSQSLTPSATATHAASKAAALPMRPVTQPAGAQISTLHIIAALVLAFTAGLSGFWMREPATDKALLAVAAGAGTMTVLFAVITMLAGRTRRPLARGLYSYSITMLMLFLWVPAMVAATFFDWIPNGKFVAQYPHMLAICSIGAVVFIFLIAAQTRGASWVLTTTQVIAGLSAVTLGIAAYRQFQLGASDPTWFTANLEAHLHIATVAAGVTGAVCSLVFLFTSIVRTPSRSFDATP